MKPNPPTYIKNQLKASSWVGLVCHVVDWMHTPNSHRCKEVFMLVKLHTE